MTVDVVLYDFGSVERFHVHDTSNDDINLQSCCRTHLSRDYQHLLLVLTSLFSLIESGRVFFLNNCLTVTCNSSAVEDER